MPNIANRPNAARPSEIPEIRAGHVLEGEFKKYMADLFLRMQAWPDQGDHLLVRVECVDKIDNASLSVDCSEREFRGNEKALYRILDRKTGTLTLREVHQVQGKKGLIQHTGLCVSGIENFFFPGIVA